MSSFESSKIQALSDSTLQIVNMTYQNSSGPLIYAKNSNFNLTNSNIRNNFHFGDSPMVQTISSLTSLNQLNLVDIESNNSKPLLDFDSSEVSLSNILVARL